jgi:2-dehydropantoate 2-reductase
MTNAVAVVGAGALGCLLAADLAAAGHDVMLVARTREAAQRLRRGIRVRSGANVATHKVHVVAAQDMTATDGRKVVVSTVKSYDLEESLRQVADWLPREGVLITIQNGLEAPAIAVKVLGADRVLAAVTETAAARSSAKPGEVERNGAGMTRIGWPAPGRPEGLRDIIALFEAAGWRATATDDIAGALWAKAAINAAINPVGALLGKPNGWLCENESARALMVAAAVEVGRVAEAAGHPLADPGARALEVARQTAANRCSMLQDVEAGRRTEIEAITGAVLRCADKLGVETPVNRTLFWLVSAIQAI